jgi:hypothetical protein
MMSYLTEAEIMDYLMTSDFNEGLTQEECRFLLLKFRYHYRAAISQKDGQKWIIENKEEKISDLSREVEALNRKLTEIEQKLKLEEDRQLTWKERIKGKKIKRNNGLK